jgi:hypothetical protein
VNTRSAQARDFRRSVATRRDAIAIHIVVLRFAHPDGRGRCLCGSYKEALVAVQLDCRERVVLAKTEAV